MASPRRLKKISLKKSSSLGKLSTFTSPTMTLIFATELPHSELTATQDQILFALNPTEPKMNFTGPENTKNQ